MNEDELTTPPPAAPEAPPGNPQPIPPASGTVIDPRTDWGPPGPFRYLVALLVLLAFFAGAVAVIWILWGRQIWHTITHDWT